MKVTYKCESCNKKWLGEISSEEYKRRRPFDSNIMTINKKRCSECEKKLTTEQKEYGKYKDSD